jgi:hypothetical protein
MPADGLTLIIHPPRPRSDAQHPTGQVKGIYGLELKPGC